MPYCVNCGKEIDINDNFCRNCGISLKNNKKEVQLVEVNLIGGVKRRLYYFNNKYYLDPDCIKEYNLTNLIEGRHKVILNKNTYAPKMYFIGFSKGILIRPFIRK